MRPLVLITNDDGVHSPGLEAVARAMAPLAEVVIAAPERQWTGAGRSMFGHLSGRVTRHKTAAAWPVYAVDGTPAQTVLIALYEILPRRPQLVIAGINAGENVGSGVTISGTVGAALEAAASGIPALAVSLEADHQHHNAHAPALDFDTAAWFTARFARAVLRQGGLPPGVDVLKIDVPGDATRRTPWRVTRVSRRRYYRVVPSRRQDPTAPGVPGYARWPNPERVFEPDSDAYTLQVLRQVAVAPLSLDLTAWLPRPQVEAWLRAGLARDETQGTADDAGRAPGRDD